MSEPTPLNQLARAWDAEAARARHRAQACDQLDQVAEAHTAAALAGCAGALRAALAALPQLRGEVTELGDDPGGLGDGPGVLVGSDRGELARAGAGLLFATVAVIRTDHLDDTGPVLGELGAEAAPLASTAQGGGR